MTKKTILFFGDSITDANRDRHDPQSLGSGYVRMLSEHFAEHKVINAGISGNRTHDLVGRLDDVIQNKPDIIAILIGINDVWHKHEWQIETNTNEFRNNMTTILNCLKETLPSSQIVLVSPFILPMGAYLPAMRPDLDEEIRILSDLSQYFDTWFIPLESVFFDAIKKNPMETLTYDGVHPTELGHKMIADEIGRVIRSLL